MTLVKQHTRKVGNKTYSVRSHKRELSSILAKAKSKFGIKHKVELEFKKSQQSDSLGYAETKIDKNGKPLSHKIRIDSEKIKKYGSNDKKVLKHEIGHVVDREKGNTKKINTKSSENKAKKFKL